VKIALRHIVVVRHGVPRDAPSALARRFAT